MGTALGVAGLIGEPPSPVRDAANFYEDALAVLRPVDSWHELVTILREHAELADQRADSSLACKLRDELDRIAHRSD